MQEHDGLRRPTNSGRSASASGCGHDPFASHALAVGMEIIGAEEAEANNEMRAYVQRQDT